MSEQAALFERGAALDADHRYAAALEICSQAAPDGPGISVAERLAAMGADTDTCIAAILSDPALEKVLANVAVERDFGPAIANLVKHVRWLNALNPADSANQPSAEQSERIRRMVLAIVDDVRAAGLSEDDDVLLAHSHNGEPLKVVDVSIYRALAVDGGYDVAG